MGDFTMRIEGLKEIDAKLSAISGPVAKKLIHNALEAGGKVFQGEVRLRAPVRGSLPHGTALPPGALKSDIELRFGFSEEGLPSAIVKPGRYTAHVARWLEYGHRLVRGGYSRITLGRVRGPGREIRTVAGGAVPAYPFIRPAFETARLPATMAAIESLKQNLPPAIQTGSVAESGSGELEVVNADQTYGAEE